MEKLKSLIPKSLEKQSGSVFYTGKEAFKGHKQLYILGINPGGNPEKQQAETIEWHTNKVMAMQSGWSAYKDESWRGKTPGTSRLQKRLLHLLKTLGLHPHEVPASNVIFVRSKRESNLQNSNGLVDLCWKFHEYVIESLGIKAVLCFGKTPGKYVRKKLNANELVGEFVEQNSRKWKTQAHTNESGVIVITATHPSVADWTSKAADPSPFIKEILK